MGNSELEKKEKIKWWQLSLFGVGAIIGTGFFLGSSMAIKNSGPSVLFAFLLAAIGTYIVYDALANMTENDPQKGAFRTYAKKAFGRWAGFSVGWVYWSSEMLIMGSQLTALSLFTLFWFPDVPLWILASIYGVLGILILLIGIKWLNRIESVFAIMKIAAIFMFIIIIFAGIFGFIDGSKDVNVPVTLDEIVPKGVMGLWTALIFAFYAFGGIEVMGLMANQLKEPKEAQKSGKVMLASLTIIYLLAIGLAIIIVPWKEFNANQSPFVIALDNYNLTYVSHVFNGALIIAGFSTMVAALYGITSILVTLAEDGDAPTTFAKKGNLSVPTPALILTVSGVIASIIMSLILPDNIYEYITTGAGLMLLYNWVFILLSARKLLHLSLFQQIKVYFGMGLIILAVSGTTMISSSRPGFFISLGFVVFIGVITCILNFKWKKQAQKEGVDSLFVKLREE